MANNVCIDALLQGKAVVVATDTVYGLMALPGSLGHEQIFALKDRPKDQALPCFVGGVQALDQFAQDVPEYAFRLADMFWPGSLTLVLKASELACDKHAAALDKTIALRCPDDKDILEMLDAAGGLLVSTSANIHGQDTAQEAHELPEAMQNLTGAAELPASCAHQGASTIVDCTGTYPKILRNGPIPEQVILDVACFGARLEPHH